MNNELFDSLELLEREKGIPKSYLLEKIKTALEKAYKNEFGGKENVKVVVDEAKKDIHMYQLMDVVEEVTDPLCQLTLEDAKKHSRRAKLGTVLEIEVKPKTFRRLSARTGKQVIIQGIREAERGLLVKAYESKKEEIITAIVLETDSATGNVILDTGKSRATMLKSELIPGETFRDGDYVKVFVTEVSKEQQGPLATFSRLPAAFVKRLFELEIPEIQDGVVCIHGVTREPGLRTKLAVYSKDENVDPIGACIGNRGMRINSIVDELNGEKIDIVKYSEDYAEFIAAALSPATVKSVTMVEEKSALVIVDPEQLSLAIGKEGINAKLVAKLTGCKIDIKTE